MERPIAFTNAAGHTLHGILHLPETRVHAPVGVVLLSPGQKCRLGPWRSYVLLARRLVGLGVPVLRFDFHGLGDSEGEHTHGQPLVDFNGFVQTGGLVQDALAAVEFFAREAGVSRFVLAGLCGGAATGLQAAPAIPGVYGHVLVDLPVTVSNSARQRYLERNAAEQLRMEPQASHGVLRGYLARLTDAGAWKRLLRGQSDYGLLRESVVLVGRDLLLRIVDRMPRPLAAGLERALARAARASTPPTASGAGAAETVNELIVRAFHAARAQGQRIFFLNSSEYHPLFEAHFGAQQLPRAHDYGHGLGLLVVPEANHVLSPDHAQRMFFETVEEFVRHAVAELAERPSGPLSPSRPDLPPAVR
jgi:pimeloyl-ACP methyl ester carboxylesterase